MKTILFFIIIIFSTVLSANESDKFLSLKKSKVNVRYGPGFDYPVKYIYKKLNLPVKIIDKKDNFRRIIDNKKNSGWININLLKNSKSLITLEDKILFNKPSLFSKPILRLQKGRLLIVQKCKKEWCKIQSENYLGWIKTNNVWGNIK
tara:strand:+ start:597 stop:1040 length:444 start_codon:yes stop_codon:yes gene_type:complete